MSCLYVYNKVSGGEKETKHHEYIINQLKTIYSEVDIFETCHGKDIKDVLINKKYKDIICAGGDGSISLLLNDLLHIGFDGFIGYIPLGTANDFARKHNIPLDVKKSLNIIENRKAEIINLGKANNRLLLYGLALGKVSGVSYKAKLNTKKRISKFSYILEGMKELFSFKKYHINLKFESHSISYKTPLVLILDTKTLGGFKVNKGKINAYDVIVLKSGLFNGLFGIISIFLFGYKKTNTMFYDYFNLSNFTIEANDIESWCLDGERIEEQVIEVSANKEKIVLYK
ncbi:MAG: hypothetical protein IJV94_00320 [Bacilli bacterium]|nr:hypothetical protein [Bacilli bacterium]